MHACHLLYIMTWISCHVSKCSWNRLKKYSVFDQGKHHLLHSSILVQSQNFLKEHLHQPGFRIVVDFSLLAYPQHNSVGRLNFQFYFLSAKLMMSFHSSKMMHINKAGDALQSLNQVLFNICSGEVAKLFADAGLICIASLISPYRKDRDACRAMLPDAFVEARLTNSDTFENKYRLHQNPYAEDNSLYFTGFYEYATRSM